MNTKTYSNGTTRPSCEHMLMAGALVGTDLRFGDGFFKTESGFLDAPECIAAGSTVESVYSASTRSAVPSIVIRPF